MLRERDDRSRQIASGAMIDKKRVAEVVGRLLEGARREYENGYAAALELIECVSWADFAMWVGVFDGAIWEFLDGHPSDAAIDAWFEQYESYVNPGDTSTEPFREGASRAVADVWSSIRAENWGTGDLNESSHATTLEADDTEKEESN
jgi:hypothetical protein